MAITIGASTSFTAVSKNSAYLASAGQLVLADAGTIGAFTVTLPASPSINTQVSVKKVDVSTNVVTVVASTVGGVTPTIDLLSSATLSTAQAAATYAFDGTNWRIIGAVAASGGSSSSGTSTDGAWVNPINRASAWYDARVTGVAANSTINLGSTVIYVPVIFRTSMVINALGIVAAAANGTANFALALYAANATTGAPGTRLAAPTAIFADTSGTAYSATFSNVTVPAGLNYVAGGVLGGYIGTVSAYSASAAPVLTGLTGTLPTAAVGQNAYNSSGEAGQPGNPPASLAPTSYQYLPLIAWRCVS